MQILRLAKHGQTMERGVIERWLKAEGDPIAVGDVLYEVETEKATVDVEATLPGRLARIVVAVGEQAPVGAVVAVVADPGEELSALAIDRALGGGRPRAMPRARALAARAGVDLASIAGTGPNGTITVGDVERAGPGSATAGRRVRERRRLTGRARSMADVMTASNRDVPQFFQQVTVRPRAGGSSIDALIAATVAAVDDCPAANASFADDAIVLYEDVDVGLAVATDAGLVVPVIRRAQTLTSAELAAARKDLVNRAREDRLSPGDVGGATLTISSLARSGVEHGMALIMPPQSALVFAGAIHERPVVVHGVVEVAPVFALSVTYDHRVLDGATAARFTLGIKRRLEVQ